MKISWIMGRIIHSLCKKGLILAGMVALVLLAPGMAVHAEDNELSKETKACLKCHDKEGEERVLENGEKLSLYVSMKAFVESMHSKTECEDCHSEIDSKSHGKKEIDSKSHGKGKTMIKSKREFSLSLRESCRDCHKKNNLAYDESRSEERRVGKECRSRWSP